MIGLGEFIRNTRIERGLTLVGLARKSGVSVSYLSKIENDKANPEVDTLEKLARALDVSKGYLLPLGGYFVRENTVQYDVTTKYQSLKELVNDWIVDNDFELHELDAEILAEELEDFYRARKRSLSKRKEGENESKKDTE